MHSFSCITKLEGPWMGFNGFDYRTHMVNSALKCRMIILITARSFCSYNNVLINFGQLYSNSCYTTFNVATLGMCIACEFHQLWAVRPCIYHIFRHLTKWPFFLPNWSCLYGSWRNIMPCPETYCTPKYHSRIGVCVPRNALLMH